MTVSLKHNFQSLKGDGTDPTKVQPSNWNEEHVLEMASGKVLGRATASTGSVEEIDWSAYGRQIINVLDAAELRGLVGEVSNIGDSVVTFQKMLNASGASKLIGSNSNPALVIVGAANNGAGLVRLTVGSTATFSTGQVKKVSGVVGTTEANGSWTITVVDATHIDLQGSAYANSYVSGGTIGGGFEEISLGSRLVMSGKVLNTINDTLHVREQSNTAGMAIVVGNNTRVLNNVAHNDISGASLSAGSVILPAGTYIVHAHAPVYGSTGRTALLLRDTTAGATILSGPAIDYPNGSFVNAITLNGSGAVTGYSFGSAAGGVLTPLFGRFVLSTQSTLQLWTYSGVAGTGGLSAGFTPNTYAEALFIRVA